MTSIKLGDKVRCIHTGFTGIAVAKVEFINGCTQFEVLPKSTKKGEMPEGVAIDYKSLELVNPKKVKVKKEEDIGGPNSFIKRRNY